jgi:hypothetical protein
MLTLPKNYCLDYSYINERTRHRKKAEMEVTHPIYTQNLTNPTSHAMLYSLI